MQLTGIPKELSNNKSSSCSVAEKIKKSDRA